ncbi:MAG: heme-binding protein [Salinirussus sp.]
MPDRRDPPPTEEGWYALHDMVRIDWDGWTAAPERDRERALDEARTFLDEAIAVSDAEEGASAVYTVLGHKADIMLVHLRPTTAAIDALERRFATTDFARFTERTSSYVSVTEASGYSERARQYFEGDLDEESGLARYIRSRLYPDIPDAEHVCFYPMDKRRAPGQNWYDLAFEERAEHMDAHGEIGRAYGGRVTQMITGSIGLDDHEWGVTLWADDLVDVKDLLYEMRFDPSTSQFAEFGPFYVGRRIMPDDLPALVAGEPVAEGGETDSVPPTSDAEASDSSAGPPTESDVEVEMIDTSAVGQRLTTVGLDESFEPGSTIVFARSDADAEAVADAVDELRESFDHYDTHRGTSVRAQGGRTIVVSGWETESAADIAAGFLADLPGVEETMMGSLEGGDADTPADDSTAAAASIRDELADLDVYAGQPHGEDVYALVCYSAADVDTLESAVADLREGFDRYDTHEGTDVYVDVDGGGAAVVSLWATADAADTASDYLADLPDIVGWADEREGFGTMGMFYTVKPEYREDFLETFDEVGDLLTDMDGHRETTLLENIDDKHDLFIASRWDAKEDAMAFFRSDAFSDTVAWGRDVLADRPRHVFLA